MEDKITNINSEEITSLDSLIEYSKGQIVRLPDFAEGQPFVARLKRPSMLVLAKSGKIPNTLLHAASSLFSGDGKAFDSDDVNMLSNLYDLMTIIVESSLIEPTYKEIIDAGLNLTDNQMSAIFNYSQNGMKALESFRD